jgi:hypothetical protein
MESMGLLTVTGLREPGLERTQSAWKFEPALPPMPGDGPSITYIQRIRKLVTTRPAKSGTGRGISKGSGEKWGHGADAPLPATYLDQYQSSNLNETLSLAR